MKKLLTVIGLIVVLLFATFVWPFQQFRYFNFHGTYHTTEYRENKLTGEIWYFTREGWVSPERNAEWNAKHHIYWYNGIKIEDPRVVEFTEEQMDRYNCSGGYIVLEAGFLYEIMMANHLRLLGPVDPKETYDDFNSPERASDNLGWF